MRCTSVRITCEVRDDLVAWLQGAYQAAGTPLGKVEAKHLLVNEYLNRGGDLTYGDLLLTMAVVKLEDGAVNLETVGYDSYLEQWRPNGCASELVSAYEHETEVYIPIYIQVGI